MSIVFGRFLTSVLSAFDVIWIWFKNVVGNIVGSTGKLNALLPLMAIAIAISVLFVAIKIIRTFTWGS